MPTTATALRLVSPRVRVILGDPAGFAENWTGIDVQTIGRDFQHAETLFAIQKWGRVADQPMHSMAAAAYYALRRTGQFSGAWEQFEAEYLEVQVIGEDTATPIEAAPAADS